MCTHDVCFEQKYHFFLVKFSILQMKKISILHGHVFVMVMCVRPEVIHGEHTPAPGKLSLNIFHHKFFEGNVEQHQQNKSLWIS